MCRAASLIACTALRPANRAIAASSVAPVASGYERSFGRITARSVSEATLV